MGDDSDDVLTTLLMPIANGIIAWPSSGGLFLRARHGMSLRKEMLPNLHCEQTFKPEADALLRAGHTLDGTATQTTQEGYGVVLLLPPRQRDEARALMAQAISRTKEGGRIVVCVANNEGARSSESDLRQLAGGVTSLSKHKCRVFWAEVSTARVDAILMTQWQQLDAPRRIAEGKFLSRPGVFAWDRIDAASALLASVLPDDLRGRAADLGAGFGYLASELLTRCRNITAIDLYEAESRALDLARENLREFDSKVAVEYRWHDVTTGLSNKYDVIVTNPPFHTQSRTDRPDIGRKFIMAAAAALNANGTLWLVANRHLAYEQNLDEQFGEVRVIAQRDGFKVIAATKRAATKSSSTDYSRRGNSSRDYSGKDFSANDYSEK